MRSVTVLVVLCTCILHICSYPSIGLTKSLNPDFVYFPDQADYVRRSMKCPDNTLLWSDSRCYREGEQGPCNIGRVLVFDQRILRPFCKDNALFWSLLLSIAHDFARDGSRDPQWFAVLVDEITNLRLLIYYIIGSLCAGRRNENFNVVLIL